MREKWAIFVVLLTGLMVLLLAVVFALIQNPTKPTDVTVSLPNDVPDVIVVEPESLDKGRQIYTQQACSFCHSIAGQGNPRYPLDSIATKYNTAEIRNRIVGIDASQSDLPERVRKIKQGYKKLSDDDTKALVVYMQSLRD